LYSGSNDIDSVCVGHGLNPHGRIASNGHYMVAPHHSGLQCVVPAGLKKSHWLIRCMRCRCAHDDSRYLEKEKLAYVKACDIALGIARHIDQCAA
jgi:hypothetical protein